MAVRGAASGRGRGAIRALGVVVPARDEAVRVEACLRSLLTAVAAVAVPCRIVLVDDGSRDRTAALARTLLSPAGHLVTSVAAGSAGAARRHGVDVLADVVRVPAERVWVASTDADTMVPRDWLRRHVRHAAAGVDALAGIVTLSTHDCWDGEVARAFDRRYRRGVRRADHRHVHAANLGVRLSSYLSVGGFPAVPTGEEHDLWRRLRRLGVRPVADPGLAVVTSGRRVGRAPDGFAADLRMDALVAARSKPAAGAR